MCLGSLPVEILKRQNPTTLARRVCLSCSFCRRFGDIRPKIAVVTIIGLQRNTREKPAPFESSWTGSYGDGYLSSSYPVQCICAKITLGHGSVLWHFWTLHTSWAAVENGSDGITFDGDFRPAFLPPTQNVELSSCPLRSVLWT